MTRLRALLAKLAHRSVDRWFMTGEIAALVVFVTACTVRGAQTIEDHLVEVAFLGASAACSQAFHIRVSAVDERISFGVAAGILGLALPSTDVLTTLTVWVVGVGVGAAVVQRSAAAGARIGGRSILLGLTYVTVLAWSDALHLPLALSFLPATAGYLAVSLLFWRLPAIVSDNGPATSHFIPRRIAMLFLLNAAIPMVFHAAEQQAFAFILADPLRMQLIMDLTVTTAVFSTIALIAFAYDARHRLDGVIRTAQALPWPDADPLQQMRDFAAATLRVDRVEVRDTPPRSTFEIGVPFRTHSGDVRYLIALRNPGSSPLLDRDLQALSAIAHIGQETMRVRNEANALRTEANTDPLTGLFNYRGFQAALQEAGSRHSEPSGVAVVYLDLDGFKAVNDRHGHDVGNQLLQEVARRLLEAVRPRDAVARVGGDEFVILLHDIRDHGHAEQVAQRVVAAAGAPVSLGGQLVPLGISAGVAFSDDHSESLENLVSEADSLMYAGRGRRLATPVDVPAAGVAKTLSPAGGRTAAIAEVIGERRLSVAYQPIVDATNGTVVALEALVRGHHPRYGAIDPSVLVHEAKRLNLLDSLAEQVLDRSFSDLTRLQRVAPGLADLHVNLELGQLAGDVVPTHLQRLRSQHPGVRLTVELTENSLHGAGEDVLARLQHLRDGGLRLALDDFGQGYSTVLAVVEVPFDALKVDRALIAHVTTSVKSGQVIRSLARLCRNLHVDMIVEGVERPEERDALQKLGVRHLQGFWFSRPESADRLHQQFASGRLIPAAETELTR